MKRNYKILLLLYIAVCYFNFLIFHTVLLRILITLIFNILTTEEVTYFCGRKSKVPFWPDKFSSDEICEVNLTAQLKYKGHIGL